MTHISLLHLWFCQLMQCNLGLISIQLKAIPKEIFSQMTPTTLQPIKQDTQMKNCLTPSPPYLVIQSQYRSSDDIHTPD